MNDYVSGFAGSEIPRDCGKIAVLLATAAQNLGSTHHTHGGNYPETGERCIRYFEKIFHCARNTWVTFREQDMGQFW